MAPPPTTPRATRNSRGLRERSSGATTPVGRLAAYATTGLAPLTNCINSAAEPAARSNLITSPSPPSITSRAILPSSIATTAVCVISVTSSPRGEAELDTIHNISDPFIEVETSSSTLSSPLLNKSFGQTLSAEPEATSFASDAISGSDQTSSSAVQVHQFALSPAPSSESSQTLSPELNATTFVPDPSSPTESDSGIESEPDITPGTQLQAEAETRPAPSSPKSSCLKFTGTNDVGPSNYRMMTHGTKEAKGEIAREIYQTIKNDHYIRRCHCPYPLICTSRAEAIASEGVFRFYKDEHDPKIFGVLIVRSDSHWHCECNNRVCERFKDISWAETHSRHWLETVREKSRPRKRKAVDSEIDLAAKNGRGTSPSRVETVRNVQAQPMWSSIKSTMVGFFNRLRGRAPPLEHQAIETRTADTTTSNVVVKRFKHALQIPPELQRYPISARPFDQLAYYEWVTDPTTYIGKALINDLHGSFLAQHEKISGGRIYPGSSVEDVKRTKASCLKRKDFDPENIDFELSLAILRLAEVKPGGGAQEENFAAARQEWLEGSKAAAILMEQFYGQDGIFAILKHDFPRPPQHLSDGYAGDFGQRIAAKDAAQFLRFFLTQKDALAISEEHIEAIAKVIVDLDAVRKQEMLPSYVIFPGFEGRTVMPGSFPMGIVEDVPVEEYDFRPVHEIKHPEQPEHSLLEEQAREAEAQDKERELNLPNDDWDKLWDHRGKRVDAPRPTKGILKPEDQRRKPDRKPTGSKLRFMPPEAYFDPATKHPVRLTMHRGRVSKAQREKWSREDERRARQENDKGLKYYEAKYGKLMSDTKVEVESFPGYRTPKREPPLRDDRDLSPEDRKFHLKLFVRDLQLDHAKNIVPLSLAVPETKPLVAATRKIEDIELVSQLREEIFAQQERDIREMAQQRAEMMRRKQEEELRQRQAEERIAREKELATKRQQDIAARLLRTGLRAPKSKIVTPIPHNWDMKVKEVTCAPVGAELTKTLEGQALERRDFEEKLLPPTAWLNDNIIIGTVLYVADYINKKAGAPASDPKCAAFTSYFWPRLQSAGVNSCGRMMRRAGVKKSNFLDIDTILIPICESSHWTLAFIRPKQRIVGHMDSMRGGASSRDVTNKAMEWVKATLEELYVEAEWKVVDYEAPRQTNGWDCGVFTITNAICVALGIDPIMAYNAKELTLQRRRLAAVLLNGGFQGDFDLSNI